MEVEIFLKKFGAYLQLHSCLVSSAKVEAGKAIDHLLDLARCDPSHREARKELAKASAMTFYESVSGGSGVIWWLLGTGIAYP